jgi:hypothetical protein
MHVLPQSAVCRRSLEDKLLDNPEASHDLAWGDGFLDDVIRSCLDGSHGEIDRAIPGKQDE